MCVPVLFCSREREKGVRLLKFHSMKGEGRSGERTVWKYGELSLQNSRMEGMFIAPAGIIAQTLIGLLAVLLCTLCGAKCIAWKFCCYFGIFSWQKPI